MTYDQWEAEVSNAIRGDTLWRLEVYRLALFLADLAWHDTAKLLKHRLARTFADQLLRSTGNISSTVGEGYSRGSSKVRCQYYEYALGSSRESRDWYFKARRALTPKVFDHRMQLCTRIIRSLLAMLGSERRSNRRLGTSPVVATT